MSFDPPAFDTHNALKVGYRLAEFEIRGLLGVGGFGIVYLAFDHLLQREVALKEYMPESLAARSATLHVSVLSQSKAETFALGLRSFIGEARMLARFEHPALVKVYRFWEANGTAYMVMPVLRGRTLYALRKSMTKSPDEAWMRQLLGKLLGALEVLHQAEVLHRDIAPDNIHIADDGAPMLLDFGAARHVIIGRDQALTAMLKPNYAPSEQYGDAPGLRQGPWTDLYALGATLHFLIVGEPPLPAPVRAMSKTTPALSDRAWPGVTPAFLNVMDWMLAPHPNDRSPSVTAVQAALAGKLRVPVSAGALARPDSTQTGGGSQPGPLDDDDVTVAMPRPDAAAAKAANRPFAGASAASVPPAPSSAPSPASRRIGIFAAVGAALVLVGAVLAWMLGSSPERLEPATVGPLADPAAAMATASAPVQSALPARPEPSASSGGVALPMPSTATGASGTQSPLAVSSSPATAAAPVESLKESAATAAVPTRTRPTPARSQPASAAAVRPAVAELRQTPQDQSLPGDSSAVVPAPPASNVAERPPASAAPAAPLDPRVACGNRVFLALYHCLSRECAKPQYSSHATCVETRRMEEQNRQR